MALTVTADGTADVVLDTPMTLATVTDAGSFVLVLDLAEMVNGDGLTVTINLDVLSGGTNRQFSRAYYQHAQADDAVVSLPVPSAHSVEFIIEQTDGTARDFPWAVWQLDG